MATLWGDYRTKPHYWGTGKMFGDRGTVAFWVKRASLLSDPLYPLFLQSSTAWGRKERDLFRVDVSPDGKLKALVRDVFYNNHTVETAEPGLGRRRMAACGRRLRPGLRPEALS